MSHEIFPTQLIVKALRDSGYKNVAYAIAELVDNSIQAGAKEVELLCREVKYSPDSNRLRIDQIAVLDNGEGMDAEVLRTALQFGNGTRLDDRKGIGRFGMGLPNSSFSQATRVDVWSWQAGPKTARYSYLDLREIETGLLREVPLPIEKAIPEVWSAAASKLGKSGTLVVWSNLDKCAWKTALAIIRHSEMLIGRIYRRFLNDGRTSIQFKAFEEHPNKLMSIDEAARPNDPLYLMDETSCPPPWDKQPMFEPFGTQKEIVVQSGDDTHKVIVRFSVAKRGARIGLNPGALPHGKHAGHNIGVSIVRADRELELQSEWAIGYDPTERWWGIEVDFPPALDEVFGVTNNKQSARSLAQFARASLDDIAENEGFKSATEMKVRWKKDKDPRHVLIEVTEAISATLGVAIRPLLKAQTASQNAGKRHVGDKNSAEQIGTDATRKRKELGHVGSSDHDENKSKEERAEAIASELVKGGLSPEEAKTKATQVVEDGRKYHFEHCDMESDAFFSVRPRGGTIIIQLNTNHPAYQHLVALLEDVGGDANIDQMKNRMEKSYRGLKLLLEAWARFEDESAASDEGRKQMQRVRADWGRVAADFMTES